MSMKRALLVVGGIVLLFVLVVGGLVGVTFMGRQPVVDGFETGGIRIVADGIVTSAVVSVGPGKVALIDAGNDVDAVALLAELSRRQLGPESVVAIFLTHGHPDHTGGAGKFPNAEVMALDREVALVEGREGATGPLLRLMPVSPTGVQVDRALEDGERVTVGEVTVQVFALPGHTPGSAAYLVNGVLFVGDSADSTSGGRLQGSAWMFSDSQQNNIASLARLSQRLRQDGLSVAAIAPAHSGVLTDGPAQLDAFAREHAGD